jgi:hypothetical protein
VSIGLGGSTALAVPATTNFTARIENGSGPVTGLINLEFKIFDAPTGGTEMWAETHNSVAATDGLVFVGLGSVDPVNNGLDPTVFTGDPMYLEVTVDGDLQSPRLPINSVPYAVHAAAADTAATLGNLAPGDVALSGHNHDSDYAPLSHNHSQYSLTTHDHDSDYAPLSHNHTQYSLTTHDHNGDYAALSHVHGSADIDAYADLSAAGRLDLSATTDLVTRSQGDTRFVNASGDSMSGALSLGTNDVTADQFRFNGTKTGYLHISALTLIGDDIIRHTGYGEAYLRAGVSVAWVEAPVHLPNGSVVTELQCRYTDADAQGQITVDLKMHSTRTEYTLASVATTPAWSSTTPQVHTDSSISYATINNGTYAYYLVVKIQGIQNTLNLSINRCRITYTYTEARH